MVRVDWFHIYSPDHYLCLYSTDQLNSLTCIPIWQVNVNRSKQRWQFNTRVPAVLLVPSQVSIFRWKYLRPRVIYPEPDLQNRSLILAQFWDSCTVKKYIFVDRWIYCLTKLRIKKRWVVVSELIKSQNEKTKLAAQIGVCMANVKPFSIKIRFTINREEFFLHRF